jgi:hypothetical protein
MSLRRFVGVFFGIVGAALLAAVLYIAFGDLSRHKGRIEALVTQSTGRPFAIDGPFKLKVIPVVDFSAERIRQGRPMSARSNCATRPCCWSTGPMARATGSWVRRRRKTKPMKRKAWSAFPS